MHNSTLKLIFFLKLLKPAYPFTSSLPTSHLSETIEKSIKSSQSFDENYVFSPVSLTSQLINIQQLVNNSFLTEDISNILGINSTEIENFGVNFEKNFQTNHTHFKNNQMWSYIFHKNQFSEEIYDKFNENEIYTRLVKRFSNQEQYINSLISERTENRFSYSVLNSAGDM